MTSALSCVDKIWLRFSELLKRRLTSAKNCRCGPVLFTGESVIIKIRHGSWSRESKSTGLSEMPIHATKSETVSVFPCGIAIPCFIPVDIFRSRSRTHSRAAALSLTLPALMRISSISSMISSLVFPLRCKSTVSGVKTVLKSMW